MEFPEHLRKSEFKSIAKFIMVDFYEMDFMKVIASKSR